MQPISKKREARFRGPTSSEEFNQWIEENYFDFVQLFNSSTENRKRIIENMDMLTKENLFLENKIQDLENTLHIIEQRISSLEVSPLNAEKIVMQSFYSNKNALEATIDETPRCEIDTKYGICHIPLQQSISKVYLLDESGNPFLPNSFQAKVYESTLPIDPKSEIDAGLLIEDQNIINAFDGNNNTFWFRNSAQTPETQEVYSLIDIELPQNIINHTRVNAIYLDPTPEYGFSILNILSFDEGSSEWNTLSSYPGSDIDLPKEIEKTNKIAFFFTPRNTVRLRIYIKQSNWISEGNSRVFCYGFKSIDILFLRFREDESSIGIRFDIPDDTRSFRTIESIQAIPMKGGIMQRPEDITTYVSSITLALDEAGDTPYQLKADLPGLPRTVYVFISLMPGNGVSPGISNVEMTYTTS